MMTTHKIDQSSRAPSCGAYIYTGDQSAPDVDCPHCLTLDLSNKPTDEQVITREDWAAIPGLLGLPEVNAKEWASCGPIDHAEFVKRHDGWMEVCTESGTLGEYLHVTSAAICDLAIPLLTARDSRVPEVGQ